jgi:hypothetical protein
LTPEFLERLDGEARPTSISTGRRLTSPQARRFLENDEMRAKNMDIRTLNYLHDAIVQEICFGHNAKGLKELVIRAQGDEDCGYTDWAGKDVRIRLVDVIVAAGTLFGHVMGEDSIAGFDGVISATTHGLVTELCNAGITNPKQLLRVSFRSGSYIEIACDHVDVSSDGSDTQRGAEGDCH